MSKCNYTKTSFKKNITSAIYTLLGALFFSFIVYAINIYTSQFITASELRRVEKQVDDVQIHFIYVRERLDEIKKDIEIIKENL